MMDTHKSHKRYNTTVTKMCVLIVPRSSSFLTQLMFLIIFLSVTHNFNIKSSSLVSGAIASVGEPDWSISKADLVNYLYSYEPYEPGREFRSIFPFFRQHVPQPPQQQQQQQQPQQQQPQRTNKISFPNPTTLFHPSMLNLNQNNNGNPQTNSNYLPSPNPTQPPPPQTGQNYPNLPKPVPDQQQYQGQLSPPPSPSLSYQPEIQLLSESSNPMAPKYTKFSLNDKKTGARFSLVQNLPDSPQQLTSTARSTPLVGPVYFNPLTSTSTTPSLTSSASATTTILPNYQSQKENLQPEASSTAVDSQTIIWPQNVEDNLTSSKDGESLVRFLVHKPGDEEIIRNALVEDGKNRNQDVKFIEGPMLRIQRHQKVYLPPKKKTVVYILLKEPQIVTDVEVVGPTEEPVPEVFITYQKSDGAIKTKHYSPEVVKNDKYLSQLRSSAVTTTSTPPNGQLPSTGNNNQKNGYNYPDSSQIDNNYSEQQLLAASQNIERIHSHPNPDRIQARSISSNFGESSTKLNENIPIMCPVTTTTATTNKANLPTTATS